MPIRLETPFNPGDLDPGKSYTDVMIEDFTINLVRKRIRLVVARGYQSGGNWVRGKSAILKHEITGDDYDAVTSLSPFDPSSLLYDQVARALYEYLIDEGIYPGVVI